MKKSTWLKFIALTLAIGTASGASACIGNLGDPWFKLLPVRVQFEISGQTDCDTSSTGTLTYSIQGNDRETELGAFANALWRIEVFLRRLDLDPKLLAQYRRMEASGELTDDAIDAQIRDGLYIASDADIQFLNDLKKFNELKGNLGEPLGPEGEWKSLWDGASGSTQKAMDRIDHILAFLDRRIGTDFSSWGGPDYRGGFLHPISKSVVYMDFGSRLNSNNFGPSVPDAGALPDSLSAQIETQRVELSGWFQSIAPMQAAYASCYTWQARDSASSAFQWTAEAFQFMNDVDLERAHSLYNTQMELKNASAKISAVLESLKDAASWVPNARVGILMKIQYGFPQPYTIQDWRALFTDQQKVIDQKTTDAFAKFVELIDASVEFDNLYEDLCGPMLDSTGELLDRVLKGESTDAVVEHLVVSYIRAPMQIEFDLERLQKNLDHFYDSPSMKDRIADVRERMPAVQQVLAAGIVGAPDCPEPEPSRGMFDYRILELVPYYVDAGKD